MVFNILKGLKVIFYIFLIDSGLKQPHIFEQFLKVLKGHHIPVYKFVIIFTIFFNQKFGP